MPVNPISGTSPHWSTPQTSPARQSSARAVPGDAPTPASTVSGSPSTSSSSSLWNALLETMSGPGSADDSLFGDEPGEPGQGIDIFA
jgi:hypothetical protein